MSRVYNFSAGPAVLPEEVLREAAAEMMDYQGTGMSVMEMSHRSRAFENILNEAEQDLKDLMQIPNNYKILFMQGRLYHHRTVGEEGFQGSADLRKGQRHRLF